MRWTSKNYPKFKQGEEYFDTALIPCMQFMLTDHKDEELKQSENVYQSAQTIDESLTGRLILFAPLVFYGHNSHQIGSSILSTLHTLKKFKHVIFLPSSNFLKEAIDEVENTQNKGLKIEDINILDHTLSSDELIKNIVLIWESSQ